MGATVTVGMVFGELTVVEPTISHRQGQRAWKCECSCGGSAVVISAELNRGSVRSCGCLGGGKPTHGMSGWPEYKVWLAMKDRCNNQRCRKYKDYGARGIKVCDRWLGGFEAFIEDVGRRPGNDYSLERLNNDKGYEPGNVKWATAQEQNRNQRSNRHITFDGRTQLLTDWAKELGVTPGTLSVRLESWSVERALTTPKRNYKRKGDLDGNQRPS